MRAQKRESCWTGSFRVQESSGSAQCAALKVKFLCGRKGSEELRFYLLLGAITLATLLRARGAKRVEYEGIPYSQRGGIHNNLVGIRNLCVERHAPGLVGERHRRSAHTRPGQSQ